VKRYTRLANSSGGAFLFGSYPRVPEPVPKRGLRIEMVFEFLRMHEI